MPLRILFADDSMTAQNMGKKILSEAGYEVVAVSNGAAAVKKIAEQKPDIIILDVYMPGYTGLEVCEKVRGSLDTLKTPVLLTVGKMEPYKPEDANRVKADGVIIKPFEASDLLAIVKKFEERINNAPPPPLAPPKTEPVPRYEEEETMAAPAEMPASHASGSRRTGMQPMVEVPDHMAGSAAFGDMLGSEPSPIASHFAINTPAAAFETSVIVPAPPVPVTDYEIPASAKEEFTSSSAEESPAFAQEEAVPAVAEPAPPPEAVTTELDAAPEVSVTQLENTLEPAPETVSLKPEPAAEPRHPQFIPVFKEPVAAEPEYAFLPTAAPPVSDVEISREPALQETAEETTRNTKVDLVEPGLMSAIGQQVKAFPADRVEEPAPAEAASSSATAESEVSYSAPVPAIEAAPELSDADFEARVAAAMAAYSHGSEPEIPPVTLTEPQPPAIAEARNTPAPYEVRSGGMPEATPTFQAPVPSFEYQPSARAAAPVPAEIESEHTSVQADAPAPGSSSSDVAKAAVAAGMEAAIPEAAAAVAADTGADQHTIAQAVHRVMEKLKPELVEEIMRELKSKK